MAIEFDQIVTIDGGGGCGKGTISQLLADALGWHLLDSGVLYRVAAWVIDSAQLSLELREEIASRISQLVIRFERAPLGGPARVWCDDIDVTDIVRSEACGRAASKTSALPWIRDLLMERQKAFACLPGLVADGRDMGTVVFPQARCKIFLIADLAVRAQRRYKQLTEAGLQADLQHIQQELAARDERDQKRAVAPLAPAEGAYILDTSMLSVDEVLARVREVVAESISLRL